jgi:Flp pilus assembly protein TadG
MGADRSGAVYVEFLIAFLPLFIFFSALAQMGMLQIADLVTKHAAVTAARAAVVVLTDDPARYEGVPVNQAKGLRYEDIRRAAEMPLTAIAADPGTSTRVSFPSAAGGLDSRLTFGEDDIVRVRVEYSYPCSVPVGNRLLCGLAGEKMLIGEAAMPNQGPNYEYHPKE